MKLHFTNPTPTNQIFVNATFAENVEKSIALIYRDAYDKRWFVYFYATKVTEAQLLGIAEKIRELRESEAKP